MSPRSRPACALGFALLAAISTSRADPAPRIEARSANLLAVGIVHGDQMSVHLSRLIDNAPVRDAVLTVTLRGATHPTIAEADGSYALKTADLEIPGSASVQFQVAQGQAHENLTGILAVIDASQKPEGEKNSARQLWWWVLNFAVCIGFLKLWSQRRKAAAEREAADDAASRD